MKKLIVLNLFGLAVVIGLAILLFDNASGSLTALDALQRVVAAQNDASEIRADMIAMSDAMRGYLLDPTRREEFDRKKAADASLVKAVEHLSQTSTNADYVARVTRIGDLDDQQLDPIEDRVLELAPTDKAAATRTYFTDYLPVRVQQMALVEQLRTAASEDFTRQVAETGARLAFAMSMVKIIGGGLVLLMVLSSAWAIRTSRRVERQIADDTGIIAEAAGGLLQSAQQVSRASQTLSQGAIQQAASLEETSASMEEMASMVRRNADHSRRASTLMVTVDQHVEASNAVLEDMVSSMGAIHEAGERVSKIIKTIDEIAFQTNILALNAAVEAARAGEAGMGFAVVADEVRSLAQRSAHAARDTAELIETSLSRTQLGQTKVSDVAAAIAGITDSVRTVKDLVHEVSSASAEQATGVDQVASALAQIDKVTQENAATAEESAAASEELKAQAESALQVVRRLEMLVGATTTRTEESAPSMDEWRAHQPRSGRREGKPLVRDGQLLRMGRALKRIEMTPASRADEFVLPQTGTDM